MAVNRVDDYFQQKKEKRRRTHKIVTINKQG